MTKKESKKEAKKLPDNLGVKPTTRSMFEKYMNLYVVEGYTMREIADDYELNYKSLRDFASDHGWGEKRRNFVETTGKSLAEKLEERARAKSQELLQKNARRARNFRVLQRAAITLLQQNIADDPDDPTRKQVTATPKELRAITATFMEAVRGEMLQDGQAIEIKTVTKEEARNPVFEAILEQEDLLVEAEFQAERLKKELIKSAKELNKLKQNGNTNAKTQKNQPKEGNAKGNGNDIQA